MLKFLKNSVKGDKDAVAKKAAGLQLEHVAVQVQKIWQQRGWVQKQKQVQKSDRGSGAKSRGWTAGLKETGAHRSRLSGRQRWSERSKHEQRRGRATGKGTTDAVGSQLRRKKVRFTAAEDNSQKKKKQKLLQEINQRSRQNCC